ncbi:MAG: NAD-dependent dehydratase [Candidatus Levybacteria bacterium CG10_big_fil_rev_8_21_14_0_10_36_7]|nr:MAG: NAD-dependent dehydratase [Candidatus Levybacteria bacterium CG10_big_fil_rev_8_21_14_0_10_36_7]
MEGVEMKVLVTGDKGYIGETLVPLLIENSFDVVGLDTDFFTTTLDAQENNNYQRITKDVRDIEEKDLEGVDAIVHLSALSNDPIGELNPGLTEEINFESSIKLARMAKKVGVKRFIFASSCSIYGIAKEDTVDESSEVNPLTAYARSKIETEKALLEIFDDNFCVGLMRNSTVYGYSPKFRNDLVVNNFVTTAIAYGQIRVMSDGSPWRPLIDVRDLSKIFVEFLKAPAEKINGKITNIGFKENNFQVKDLLNEVKKQLPECEVVYTGEHGKDSRSYKVNFDKLKSMFPEIKQEWTLDKSVADLITHLRNAHYSKEDFEEGIFTRLSVLKQLISQDKVTQDLRWK